MSPSAEDMDSMSDEDWDEYGAEKMMDREYYGRGQSYDGDLDLDFADPGGNSALRAATSSNPRDRPCPDCERKNVLTREDERLGYCCDRCAERKERGMDY